MSGMEGSAVAYKTLNGDWARAKMITQHAQDHYTAEADPSGRRIELVWYVGLGWHEQEVTFKQPPRPQEKSPLDCQMEVIASEMAGMSKWHTLSTSHWMTRLGLKMSYAFLLLGIEALDRLAPVDAEVEEEPKEPTCHRLGTHVYPMGMKKCVYCGEGNTDAT